MKFHPKIAVNTANSTRSDFSDDRRSTAAKTKARGKFVPEQSRQSAPLLREPGFVIRKVNTGATAEYYIVFFKCDFVGQLGDFSQQFLDFRRFSAAIQRGNQLNRLVSFCCPEPVSYLCRASLLPPENITRRLLADRITNATCVMVLK